MHRAQRAQLSTEKKERFFLALDASAADASALAPAILEAGSTRACDGGGASESDESLDDSDSDSLDELLASSAGAPAPPADVPASASAASVVSFCEKERRSAEGRRSDSFINAPDMERRAFDGSDTSARRARCGVLSIGRSGRGAGPCTCALDTFACDSGCEK